LRLFHRQISILVAIATVFCFALTTTAFAEDTTQPEPFTLISPVDNAVNQRNETLLSWNEADDLDSGIDHYELRVDDATVEEIDAVDACFQGVCRMWQESGGNLRNWQIRAVDHNGNSRDSEVRTYSLDRDPPNEFQLTSSGILTDTNAVLTWDEASDPGVGVAGYQIFIDGSRIFESGQCIDGECSVSFLSAPGHHTWFIKAFDWNGNFRDSDSSDFTATVGTSLQTENTSVSVQHKSTRTDLGFTVSPVGPGQVSFECSLDGGPWTGCGGTISSGVLQSQLTGLSDGSHTLAARSIHPEFGADPSPGTLTWTVDTQSPPTASLSPEPSIASTGQQVILDASASSAQLDGTIVSYEFDPQGDGTFTNPSGSPTLNHTYSSKGTYDATVRVTNQNGIEATASVPVTVRLAPPDGPLGISINDGAKFTNDPHVLIYPVWPELAQSLLISNDGGFKPSGSPGVAETVPWTLDSAGSERIPKTVYVRFQGGDSGRETYQDDIILDQTAPVLSRAISDCCAAGASSVSARGHRARITRIRLRAHDRTSGVRFVQTAVKKKRPAKKTRYRSRITVHGAVPKFVRVQDRAGNFSRWKKIRRR